MINYTAVRDMVTLIILTEIYTQCVGFLLACTQADLRTEVSMEVPVGFGIRGVFCTPGTVYVLQVNTLGWVIIWQNLVYARGLVQLQKTPLCHHLWRGGEGKFDRWTNSEIDRHILIKREYSLSRSSIKSLIIRSKK